MNRIFISSTYYDCIDLRAEIAEELRGLGLTPVLELRPWVNGVSLEQREVTPGNMRFIKINEPGG